MQPKEKVYQTQAVCPACGQLRTPEMINCIGGDSPYLDMPLSDLGIPDKEILKFTGDTQSIYLQFGK